MDTTHPGHSAPLSAQHVSTALLLLSILAAALDAAAPGHLLLWISGALLIPSTAAAAAAKGRSLAWGALGAFHIVGHIAVWALLRKRCWRCGEIEASHATECAMCAAAL